MEDTTKLESHERSGHSSSALLNLLKEIGPFAILGIVLAVVALALFAKLSEEVFTQEITSIDNGVSTWLHSLASPALDTFFKFISTGVGVVGVVVFSVLAFALLYWRKEHYNAWRLALIVMGGLIINQVLKMLFHRTRPDLWQGPTFAGFSFPSGHATMSFCLYGMFIWLGWRYISNASARVLWAVFMVVLILLVGLSRIYLGAHYLSDVAAGYLAAAVWMLAVLSGTDIYRRLKAGAQQPAPTQKEQ